MRYLFIAIYGLCLLLPEPTHAYVGRDESNRWLYDRNKMLQHQKRKRQRYYKCQDGEGSCSSHERWLDKNNGKQKLYFEPHEHPDAAGNEDRP